MTVDLGPVGTPNGIAGVDLAVLDVDGDGRDDVVAGTDTGDVNDEGKKDVVASAYQVYVLRGQGPRFTAVTLPPFQNTRSSSLGIGDVDHDGRDDVAIVTGIDVGHQPTFVASGDLDNDGVPSCAICADAALPLGDSCSAIPQSS